MKKLAIVAAVGVVAALMVGVAFAAKTVSRQTGGYTIEFATEKSQLTQGKNNVEVAVKDRSGAAVTGARVVIDYSIPAMAGMPAKSHQAVAEPNGDAYAAVLEPCMPGPWTVAVRVTVGGKIETATFPMDVGKEEKESPALSNAIGKAQFERSRSSSLCCCTAAIEGQGPLRSRP